jgi:hypothetical protein
MQVMIDIPDGVAEQMAALGKDPSRTALESLALEGYRNGMLSEGAVRQLLGLDTRLEVHEFLAEHEVDLNYGMAEWQHDRQVADRNVAQSAEVLPR